MREQIGDERLPPRALDVGRCWLWRDYHISPGRADRIVGKRKRKGGNNEEIPFTFQ
jgi:hypothetical protein